MDINEITAFRQQAMQLCAGLSGSIEFYAVLVECMILHHRKQQDYADRGDPFANFRESADFVRNCDATQAIDLHIGNKFSRLRRLNKGQVPNNESISDTRRDLINYLALREALEKTPEKHLKTP